MLSEQICRIPAGEVRSFFVTDITETLQSFEIDKTTFINHAAKVVVQTWASLPEQEQLIGDVLRHLADIVLATWPFWYGQTTPIDLATLQTTPLDLARLLPKPTQLRQPLSPLWLKRAAVACAVQQPPLFGEFTRGQQLAQLALTIEPGNLLIILAVDDAHPRPYRLFGLARTAVWLATTTAARVALLVSRHLASHTELESLAYHAVTLDDPAPPMAVSDETTKSSVWPIQGRPHPFSPGEKLLAAQLAQDRELAPLFVCNECVETVCQSRYWVDLLWCAGQVVVEIDGYRNHSSRAIFNQDRQRDYELLLSGYRVLRLPHDEVMANVELALTKIRQVVHLVAEDRVKSNGTASSNVNRK